MSFRQRSVLRAVYTALAPAYAPLSAWLSSRARATGRRWLDTADGERVLDVGCGPGHDLQRFAAANPSGWTHGLDATPVMLARARRRASALPHDRYTLRRGNARTLPYPNGHFDALFSAYLVDLLPADDIPRALAEMRRVLRPEGRLVLVTMAQPQRLPGRLWTGLARACPPLLGGSRPVDPDGPLRDAGFRARRRTTRTQVGLPSAIVLAEAAPNHDDPPASN